MEKSCNPPYPFRQMQPAPIPPRGNAIWVDFSPLKVRCEPLRRRSSDAYGKCPVDGSSGAFDAGVTGWAPAKGTAAPNAADEVVTRNSLRVDFSESDIVPLRIRNSPDSLNRPAVPGRYEPRCFSRNSSERSRACFAAAAL